MSTFIRVFASCVLLLIASTASAQTWTQTGAGPHSWITAANWSTGVPNAVSASATFTTAGGPATQTITLDAAITLGSLDLTNTSTSYNFTAGTGGSFTFNNGATASTITMGPGSLAQTISANLTAGAIGLNITNASAGALLTIAGNINPTANAVPLTFAGNSAITVTGTLFTTAAITNNSTALLTLGNTVGNTGLTTPLTFDGSGSTVINGTVASNGTFIMNGTGTVILNADINNFGAALTLNAANATGTVTVNGIISGAGSLTKSGDGAFALTGANTYTGSTTLIGGMLNANAVNALGAVTNTLTYGNQTALTGGLTANANQQVKSFLAQSNGPTANTLSIGSGSTFTVTGSTIANVFVVGLQTTNTLVGVRTDLTVSGLNGTLTISDPTRNIVVSQLSTNNTSNHQSNLDMSGLGTFNATATHFYIGRPTNTTGGAVASRSFGTVRLAKNSNTITLTGNLVIGTQSQSALTGNSLLLGTNNTIGANNVLVAGGRSSSTLAFDTGLVNPTVTLFGGSGSTSRITTFMLGDQRNTTGFGSGGGGSSTSSGVVDFSAGTVNALIGTLTIGNGGGVATNNRGIGSGSFTFGGADSVVNVNTITIATNGSDTTATTATNATTSNSSLTMNGGSLIVNSALTLGADVDATGGGIQDLVAAFNLNGGTATIGSVATPVNTILGNHNSTNPGSVTATLTITGGTYISNGDIRRGAIGSGTITSSVILNGGTLDLTSHSIGTATNPVTTVDFRAGTLANVAGINAGAGFTKTTTGILHITGNNAFNGPVAISEGTLNIAASAILSLGSGDITVADGATLRVTAFSNTTTALTNNAILNLGSTGATTLNLTLAGNGVAPIINATTLNTSIGGLTTVTISSTAPLAIGQFPLIDYTGAIGGGGFAGFAPLSVANLPPRVVATLVENVASESIDLNITAIDTIRWKGNVNAVWDINTTQNWVLNSNGVTSTTYLQPSIPGDTVTFDDTASTFTVNLSTALSPSSVTFSNSANNYTVTGSGSLTTALLTKSGTSLATINSTGALAITTIALNGTGALVIDRTDNLNLASALTGTGVLRKVGTNTLTLSGTSPAFAGTVDVAAGTLALGSSTAIGLGTVALASGTSLELNGNTLPVGTGGAAITGSGSIVANDFGFLQFTSSTTFTQPISGTGGVRMTGGTVLLTGAVTYTGGTFVSGGTAKASANNSFSTAGALILGNAAGDIGALDLDTFNQTFTSFAAQSNGTTENTIAIGTGNTLTFSGSIVANAFVVGTPATTGAQVSRLTVTGPGGTIVVNDPTRNMVFAQISANTSSTLTNLSALGTLNATIANLYVGRPTTAAGAATTSPTSDTLILANTNTIAAGGNIVIGSQSATGTQSGTLRLGTSNIISATQWVVGGGRTPGTVNFNTGLTNPAVSLFGTGGPTTRTNIILGDQRNGTGAGSGGGGSTNITGTMDFSGGTLTALIGTLTVGNGGTVASSARAQGNGTFIFGGDSSVNINTLVIATVGSDTTATTLTNATSSIGTFTMNGGVLQVNTALTLGLDPDITGGGNQDLIATFTLAGGTATIGSTGTPVNTVLGNHTSTNPGSITATLTINGGTYNSFGNLQQGALGSGSITSTITLNGGTLNLNGNAIGSATGLIGTLNFQAGTLSNVSQINAGAGLNKTSPGTLTVTGANAFTGPVTVNEGTLNLQSTTPLNLGVADLLVADGATLSVKAVSTTASAIASSGNFFLGLSVGSTLNITLAGNGTVAPINVASFFASGTNTINISANAALALGQVPLIDYLSGTGTLNLTLGTLPPRVVGTLVENVANTSVDLNITAIDSIRWKGNVNAVWDIDTTQNWVLNSNGTTATTYLQPGTTGDAVNFDDTAAANFSVNVSTALSPAAITFNNSTNAYSLTGTGNLVTGTLTKNGTNTATLSTTGTLDITSITINTGVLAIDRVDNLTISSALAGAGTLRKLGTNTLTLSGNGSGFTGTTDVVAGTMRLGSNNALGTSTAVLAAAATLDLNGFTQTVGTGGISITGSGTIAANNNGTLRFTSTVNFTNPITGNGGIIAAANGGTVTIANANTYTGTTAVIDGTLTNAVANAWGAGALLMGNIAASPTTASTLNVAFDATHTTFGVGTNTIDNNTLTIAAGRTLTLTGNVNIGSNVAAQTITNLVTSGGGALVVNNPAANGLFVVGGVTSGGGLGSVTSADLSGLGSLTINLDPASGIVRVNPVNGSNVTGQFSTLTLPATSTITANLLNIGDSSQNNSVGQLNTLRLGSGVNTLNVNTLNIGTGGRDQGQVLFNSPTSGSVVFRNATGIGRVAVNMGTGTATTGVQADNLLDLRDHTADLLISTLAMGTQPRSHTSNNTLWFNQGTLDVQLATLATSTQTAESASGNTIPRVTNSTINIGGGTAVIAGGILNMGLVAGTGYTVVDKPRTMNGALNVTGGTVTIGATGGVAITMATVNVTGAANIAPLAANGSITLTGGTTTIQGSIVSGGVSATSSSTGGIATSAVITLNGGTLDMSGNTIGDALVPVTLNAVTGTLRNLGQYNGGAALVKSTPGTVTIAGANTYTGDTTINDGTVSLATAALLAGPSTVNGGTTGGTLRGTGAVTGLVTVNGGTVPGTIRGGNSLGTLTLGGGLILNAGANVAVEIVGGVPAAAGTGGSTIGTLPNNVTSNSFIHIVSNGATISTGTLFTVDLSGASLLPSQSYSYKIIDGAGDQTGFVISNPSQFTFIGATLDAVSVTSDATGVVYLNFTATPIPEPALLLGLVALGILARRHR